MRLRNKKTGEIKELPDGFFCGDSLKKICEEWEDYEEPKEYWYIDPMVCGIYCTKIKKDGDLYGFNKQIGNYFDTQEEAKLAVRKLKAWKRLKDKGFKFGRWQFLDDRSGIWVRGKLVPGIVEELDILFSGEDD